MAATKSGLAEPAVAKHRASIAKAHTTLLKNAATLAKAAGKLLAKKK